MPFYEDETPARLRGKREGLQITRAYRQIVGFASSATHWAACHWRAHIKRRRNLRDYNKLLQLPDYLLKDMGLPRQSVHRQIMQIHAGQYPETRREK